MILSNLFKFTNQTALLFINENSKVIDCTCGNGNDTHFLASVVKNGHVFAFDIQQEAIKATKLKCHGLSNIEYILDSHEHLNNYITSEIDLIMFNLGFLPNSDSLITTVANTTIACIKQGLDLLKINGGMIITIYTKHDNHLEEKALIKFINTLSKYDYNVLKYQFLNLDEAPYVIVIEKKK